MVCKQFEITNEMRTIWKLKHNKLELSKQVSHFPTYVSHLSVGLTHKIDEFRFSNVHSDLESSSYPIMQSLFFLHPVKQVYTLQTQVSFS